MKKQFLSFSVTMLLLSSLSFAQIPTSGLIAYYPFNGNANDASGNNYNGTVKGATLTTDRFNVSNNAYLFSGVQGSTINLPFPDTKNNFTISIWVKATRSTGSANTTTDCYPSVSVPLANSNQNWLLLPTHGGNGVNLGVGISFGNDRIMIAEHCTNLLVSRLNSIQTRNDFTHIVLTYSTSKLELYVDNKLISSQPMHCTSVPKILGNTLGVSYFSPEFSGIIDDIRIYNRPLTQNEVSALYSESQCVNNITVTDTLKIGRITGINTLPNNFGTVKVYPNPSNDVLNIAVSNPSANYSIQITNQLGQVLYTNSLSNSSLQVNVNSIGSNGLYFIKILDLSNNVLDTRKLVLE